MRLLLFCCCIVCCVNGQSLTGPKGEIFTRRVVARGLSDPWEIAYGPDGYLWVTESKAYQVSRIDPATGKKQVLLNLTDQRLFPRYDKLQKQTGGKPWPQGGLMGTALHPQLLTGSPYVFLAYHYRFAGATESGSGCKDNFGGCFFTTRIVRYEYSKKADKLINPVTICDTIPGSNDHNGGRLVIAPVSGKLYLFYGIGDMGAGQFNNAGRPNHAQQPEVYEGKILRFNISPDNDPSQYDRWIPNDNPFNQQKQNAVYSYGHRNPQGLAYAEVSGTGYLYESEHGPYSDDEVNIIKKGKNYGHPLISGYADGNYNGLALSVTKHSQLPGLWHTTYPQIESEQTNATTIGSIYQNPIVSLYPTPNDSLFSLFNNIRADTGRQEWISEAPSSIAVYTATAIPGWKNSILLTSLKNGHLIRLQLKADGSGITGDTMMYFKAPVRYRDIAISPDGKKIYLSTDSAAVSSGPSAEDPQKVSDQGCIIEFSYQGTQQNGATPAKKDD